MSRRSHNGRIIISTEFILKTIGVTITGLYGLGCLYYLTSSYMSHGSIRESLVDIIIVGFVSSIVGSVIAFTLFGCVFLGVALAITNATKK